MRGVLTTRRSSAGFPIRWWIIHHSVEDLQRTLARAESIRFGKRIARRECWEAAEVAIGGPELVYTVDHEEPCHARVVQLPFDDATADEKLAKESPRFVALRRQHEARRFDPRI